MTLLQPAQHRRFTALCSNANTPLSKLWTTHWQPALCLLKTLLIAISTERLETYGLMLERARISPSITVFFYC